MGKGRSKPTPYVADVPMSARKILEGTPSPSSHRDESFLLTRKLLPDSEIVDYRHDAFCGNKLEANACEQGDNDGANRPDL